MRRSLLHIESARRLAEATLEEFRDIAAVRTESSPERIGADLQHVHKLVTEMSTWINERANLWPQPQRASPRSQGAGILGCGCMGAPRGPSLIVPSPSSPTAAVASRDVERLQVLCEKFTSAVADLRKVVDALLGEPAITALPGAASQSLYKRPQPFQSVLRRLCKAGEVVLVRGPAGSGKTSLLKELQRLHEQERAFGTGRYPAGAVYWALQHPHDTPHPRAAHDLLEELCELLARHSSAEGSAAEPQSFKRTVRTRRRRRSAGAPWKALQAALARGYLLLVDHLWHADAGLLQCVAEAVRQQPSPRPSTVVFASQDTEAHSAGAYVVELSSGSCEPIAERLLASLVYGSKDSTGIRVEDRALARKVLHACGHSPAVIQLASQRLHCAEEQNGWDAVAVGVTSALDELQSTYSGSDSPGRPCTNELAWRSLSPESQSLASTLAHFPACTWLPAHAGKLVWAMQRGQSERFRGCLQELQRASLIETSLEGITEQLMVHKLASLFLREHSVEDTSWLSAIELDTALEPGQGPARMAGVCAVCALALFADGPVADEAEKKLAQVSLPNGTVAHDWWQAAIKLGSHPEVLLKAVGDAPVRARCTLLLSAARKQVWPGLEAEVGKLLGGLDTVLPAVAFKVGTLSCTELPGEGWTAACSDAIFELAVQCQTAESELLQALAVKVLAAVAAVASEVRWDLDALVLLGAVAAIQRRLYGGHALVAVATMTQLAVVLARHRQHVDAACKYASLALTECRTRLGGHPDMAAALCSAGMALRQLGRDEEALQHQMQALQICERALGREAPQTAVVAGCVGDTLHAQGKRHEALESKQRALQVWEREWPGEERLGLARSLESLADTQRALGQKEEALVSEKRALKMLESLLGPNHEDVRRLVVAVQWANG